MILGKLQNYKILFYLKFIRRNYTNACVLWFHDKMLIRLFKKGKELGKISYNF